MSKILEEAAKLVEGDRQSAYGHPRQNFQTIADLWTVIAHRRGLLAPGDEFQPRDVAQFFRLAKEARQAHAVKEDNLTDIVGYCLTEEMLHTPTATSRKEGSPGFKVGDRVRIAATVEQLAKHAVGAPGQKPGTVGEIINTNSFRHGQEFEVRTEDGEEWWYLPEFLTHA